MSKKIKVGVVGYGISAKTFHVPFLINSSHYEITAVLERNRSDSQALLPNATIVRSFDELVAMKDVDLVVITTPNETHFPYSLQALQAGKHVVVEKPFTNTSEEALQLANAAKQAGKVLSVYQNRRYVSDFLTIKDVIDKKLLGEVHDYEAHYDRYRAEARPNAWREQKMAGSGIFYDLGAHLIDQTLYLFGLPQMVTADIRMQRPHAKVDDYFDVRLDYGYLRVTLKGGMLVREPGPRYMIHGYNGSFIKYGEDPQEALLRAGQMPTGKHWGEESEDIFGLLHTEVEGKIVKEKYPSKKGDYGAYYENLYQSIAHHKPVSEKPEHGYNTIKIIEQAFESSHKKATVACEGLLDVSYTL